MGVIAWVGWWWAGWWLSGAALAFVIAPNFWASPACIVLGAVAGHLVIRPLYKKISGK